MALRIGLILMLFISAAFYMPPEKNDTPYPKDYFEWPVKHKVRISGTFGELRPNHFHAGIDIKSSKGQWGDPLYAAGPGYVSRINVSGKGYGNALYITHPNGYVTVYAHLQEFSEPIQEYVRAQQYELETFELELYPPKEKFALDKGAYIGKMGSTGSSGGPHLHFEIREETSEKPVNPLLFGLSFEDRIPPRMHQLKVYELDEKLLTRSDKIYKVYGSNGKYTFSGDTLQVGSELIGLGLKVYDHHNYVSNWNGIYQMEMWVDDSLAYEFRMNSFSFEETRYLNAHLDYREHVTHRAYFNRCFRLPGNQLSIYDQTVSDGLLRMKDGEKKKIRIRASDFDGNESDLDLWVKRTGTTDKVEYPSLFNYLLLHNEENLIKLDACMLYFPEGILYEDLEMELNVSEDGSSDHFSKVYHIHDYKTAVHPYFNIYIKPNRDMTEEQRKKAFVAYCLDGGYVKNYGGEWQNEYLKAPIWKLGDYCIMVDEEPPTVKAKSFRYDLRDRSTMSFTISDNVAASRHTPGLSYRATVDGQWILLEYDKKSGRLLHRFDGHISPGEHTLRLEVSDAVGNTTVYEKGFRR